MMKDLYLDAGAHVSLSDNALKAYTQFMTSRAGHGNPAAPSVPGIEAAQALEKARQTIAELIGAEVSQIIFTSTCTQAAQWGIQIFDKIKTDNNNKYVSPIEHPAVRFTTKDWNKLKVNSNGIVLTEGINADKVACIHIQNEIGIIQPLDLIKNDTKYLFTDMCQSLGKIPIDLEHADIAIFGAHKFGGPASAGILYISDPEWWAPFGTGSRYSTDRTGTMDVGSIVATAAALTDALETLPERSERALEFRKVLEPGLKEMGFKIIGEGAKRCPNTTFVHVPNKRSQLLLFKLGEVGIHVGLGSACGSLSSGDSPTMQAMGVKVGTEGLMRFSQFGLYGENEAKRVLLEISKLI